MLFLILPGPSIINCTLAYNVAHLQLNLLYITTEHDKVGKCYSAAQLLSLLGKLTISLLHSACFSVRHLIVRGADFHLVHMQAEWLNYDT